MAAGFPCAAGLDFTAENAIQIALACGAVVAAALLMVVLAMWARKRAQSSFTAGPPPDRLTVEKLEEMLRCGQISREEFSALRMSALGLKGPSARKGLSGLTEGLRHDDESKTDPPAGGQAPRPGEETPPPP
jgi:hypothetical protein